MSHLRFPTLPIGEKEKADKSLTKLALKSHVNLTNSTSFSHANTTSSDDKTDELLSWIDSLKIRARETFARQSQELLELRKNARREELRRKYREQIDLTSFDKLGELLKRQETSKNGQEPPSTNVPLESAAHEYRDSPYPEDESKENIEESDIEALEEEDRRSEICAPNLAYTLNFDPDDDDVVEILSDESAAEGPEPARPQYAEYSEAEEEDEDEQELEEDYGEEFEGEYEDSAEDFEEYDEEHGAEEDDENESVIIDEAEEEELHENLDQNREFSGQNLLQIRNQTSFSPGLKVAYHVQNGRPRLSDFHPQSYTQNEAYDYAEEDEEDAMESEDFSEMSDNLDAVEDKYSDEELEDEIERQLDTRNYSGSGREKYHHQMDRLDVFNNASLENQKVGLEYGSGASGSVQNPDNVSSSANMFETENLRYHSELQNLAEIAANAANAELEISNEEGHVDIVALPSGSELQSPAENASFHHFTEEDSAADSEFAENDDEDHTKSSLEEHKSSAHSLDHSVESADAEASSPENPEVTAFLDLLSQGAGTDMFADLAQEALSAHAAVEAQMTKELNETLRRETEKLLATGYAQSAIDSEAEDDAGQSYGEADESDDLVVAQNEPLSVGEGESLLPGERTAQDDLHHGAELGDSGDVGTDENELAEIDPVSSHTDPHEAVLFPPAPAVKFRSFKTISEEDPRKILKQLKATQKKFNIKLDAVEQLTIEVGEVLLESDYTDAPSPPQISLEYAEIAELIQANMSIQRSADEKDLPMDSAQGESSKAEDVTDRISEAFSQKPELPILSDIDDDEIGTASESEALAANSGLELPQPHAVIIEPHTEEATLVLFDEYTEVENTKFLTPSAIEEPEAEQSAQVFTDLAIEMVTEIENDVSITPSEVIEPVEPLEAFSVARETFEEASEFAVPTSVVELESMRNTPVSYNLKDVEEIAQDEETEERLLVDVSMERSESENTKEDSRTERLQTDLVQEGELDTIDVHVLEPVISLEKGIDVLSGKTTEMESLNLHDANVEASELLAQGAALPEANDYVDTNLENLEDYQNMDIPSTSVSAEPGTGDMEEDEESNLEDCENHEKSESVSETDEMVSDFSTTKPGAKRKLNEELRSSSPVKKLRTALSKLNPFSWRFSDRSSLEPQLNDQANDLYAGNVASTRNNEPISVHSETSAESECDADQNADQSTDEGIEEEKSSLKDHSERGTEPDSENASQERQEEMHGDFDVLASLSVTAGKTAVSSLGENETIAEYVQSAESDVPEDSQFVPLESPRLESFVADAGAETQEDFEAIDSEDADLQTVPMSERSVSIDENVSSPGESSHADESLSDEAIIDTTPSSASVSSGNENTIVLSVPPLPTPASFMRIAEAVREDEDANEFVYSSHSSASSEVTRNIAETTERIQTLTRPIPEIMSYIDVAVTPLMADNIQEEPNLQGEEDAIDVESKSDHSEVDTLAHGEKLEESQNEPHEQEKFSENEANEPDLAMLDTQDAAGDKAAEDPVDSEDSQVEDQKPAPNIEPATRIEVDMLNDTKISAVNELDKAIKSNEKPARDTSPEPSNTEESIVADEKSSRALVSPERPIFQLIPPLTENLPVAALEENVHIESDSMPEEDQGEVLVARPEKDMAEDVSFTKPDISSSLLPAPDTEVPWLTRPKSNDLQNLLTLMRKKADQQIQQNARDISEQDTVSSIDTADRSANSEPLVIDTPNEGESGREDPLHHKTPSEDDVKHGESDEVDGHPEAKVEEPATDTVTAEDENMSVPKSNVDDTPEQTPKDLGVMSKGMKAHSASGVSLEQVQKLLEPASEPEERTAKIEETEYDLTETKVEPSKDEPVKALESPKTPKKADLSKATGTPIARKSPKTPVARRKNLLKKSLGPVTPRTRYLRSQTQHSATNVTESSVAAETKSDHNADSAGLSNENLEGSTQYQVNETNQDQESIAKASEMSADAEPHESLKGDEKTQLTSRNAEQDMSTQAEADDQVKDVETEASMKDTTAAPQAPSSPRQETQDRPEGVQTHGVDHSQKSAEETSTSLAQNQYNSLLHVDVGTAAVSESIQKEAEIETKSVIPILSEPVSSDLSEKKPLDEEKLNTNPVTTKGRPGRMRSSEQVVKEEVATSTADEPSTTRENQDSIGAKKAGANVTTSDVKGELISASKKKRGRPPKKRSAKVKANPEEKSAPLSDLNPEEKPSETKVVKSSPFKGKPGRKPKPAGAHDEKDLLATPDKHLLVKSEDSEDHPALRTRLKSPIKRSIQEIATDIDAGPIKKKRNVRRRKAAKKVDDAEAAKEQDMRGRTRKR